MGGQGDAQTPLPPPVPAVKQRVPWRHVFPRLIGAAFAGTVLLGVFQFLLPVLLLLVLIVPLTGAMSVWFSSRGEHSLSSGAGFKVGLVAGFFLSAFNVGLGAVGYALNRDEVLGSIKKQFELAAQAAQDPAAREMMTRIPNDPSALLGFVLLGALLMTFIFMIACGIGGAIAGRSARHSA